MVCFENIYFNQKEFMLKILFVYIILLLNQFCQSSEYYGSDSRIIAVDTVDDLGKIKRIEQSNLYIVMGYHAIGDGGGGYFIWKAHDKGNADGGTIFEGSDDGRFYRTALEGGPINIQLFGVIPGDHDYTLSADRAAKYCWENNKVLYVPAGKYIYNGFGLGGNSDRYSLFGDGRGKTEFYLGKESYLLSSNVLMKSLDVHDISVIGGLGCIQHKFTGVDVQESFKVADCDFLDYSRCAIYTNSQDMPYWYISNNLFHAINDTNTIGFAHGGYSDNCTFFRNDFQKNTVSIKLRRGGNNSYIFNNDFLRWDSYNSVPRVSIWIVPETIPINAGPGLCVRSNKFGNENLSQYDFPILFADEKINSDTGDSFPSYAAESKGYIDGHIYSENLCNNIGLISPPFIYSMTKNIRGILVGPLVIAGGAPKYILEFCNDILPLTPDRLTSNNRFGPFSGSSVNIDPGHLIAISNGIGVGSDSNSNTESRNLSKSQSNNNNNFSEDILVSSFGSSGKLFVTPTADSENGTDAVTLRISDGYYYAVLPKNYIKCGIPIRIEFDISSDSSDVVDVIIADKDYLSNGLIHARRQIKSNPDWSRFNFTWTPRVSNGNTILGFRKSEFLKTSNIKIGRIRIIISDNH